MLSRIYLELLQWSELHRTAGPLHIPSLHCWNQPKGSRLLSISLFVSLLLWASPLLFPSFSLNNPHIKSIVISRRHQWHSTPSLSSHYKTQKTWKKTLPLPFSHYFFSAVAEDFDGAFDDPSLPGTLYKHFQTWIQTSCSLQGYLEWCFNKNVTTTSYPSYK